MCMCGHVSDGFVLAFWSFVAFYSVLIVEDVVHNEPCGWSIPVVEL